MRYGNRLKAIAVLVLLAFAWGCATPPDQISPSYCSPALYQDYSCEQINQELNRVRRKVIEVTNQQQSEATKDAVAFGVGMVLFWPALFFMIGDDKKAELARLKGEYETLEDLAIQKECAMAEELRKARELREAEAREKADEGVQEGEPGSG